MGKPKRDPDSVELANKIIEQYQPKIGRRYATCIKRHIRTDVKR